MTYQDLPLTTTDAAERASTAPAGIVVGTDGSPNASQALDWALCEAAARRVPLRVVVAPSASDAATVALGAEVLREVAARCRERMPDLPVTGVVCTGQPAAALLAQAAGAELLVVGHSGRGGRLGMHVGSVPAAVLRHASCPVAVIHSDPAGNPPAWSGDVLAGIDSSVHDEVVLDAAFAAAEARTGRLTIAHAWDLRSGPGQRPAAGGHSSVEAVRDATAKAQAVLDAAIAGWAGRFPRVRVATRAVPGGPIQTLARLSAGHQLLVLGACGKSAEPAQLLGSVPRALVGSVPCPVLVVRATRSS